MNRAAKVVAFVSFLCAVVLWGAIFRVRPKPTHVYDGVEQISTQAIDDALLTVDFEPEIRERLRVAGRFVKSANEDVKTLRRLGQITAFVMVVSSVVSIWMLSDRHRKKPAPSADNATTM